MGIESTNLDRSLAQGARVLATHANTRVSRRGILALGLGGATAALLAGCSAPADLGPLNQGLGRTEAKADGAVKAADDAKKAADEAKGLAADAKKAADAAPTQAALAAREVLAQAGLEDADDNKSRAARALPRSAGQAASPVASPSATATTAPTATAVPATATAVPTVTPGGVKTLSIQYKEIQPAPQSGDSWSLKHPDQDKIVSLKLPEGFIPAVNLHAVTDVKANTVDMAHLDKYSDWETILNTKRKGGALAGYNYDYNDWCAVPGFYCNVQGDMYGWRTFQGMEARIPGIGTLVGGPRRSGVVNVLNLADSVHPWDIDGDGPIYLKRGFTATGRIFDGHPIEKIVPLEEGLTGHWVFRNINGTPEKSYIGITDSKDNAREVLTASVLRRQWGNNPDGTPRIEFQLMRAEILGVKK